jgi:paraquat-inducible protein B
VGEEEIKLSTDTDTQSTAVKKPFPFKVVIPVVVVILALVAGGLVWWLNTPRNLEKADHTLYQRITTANTDLGKAVDTLSADLKTVTTTPTVAEGDPAWKAVVLTNDDVAATNANIIIGQARILQQWVSLLTDPATMVNNSKPTIASIDFNKAPDVEAGASFAVSINQATVLADALDQVNTQLQTATTDLQTALTKAQTDKAVEDYNNTLNTKTQEIEAANQTLSSTDGQVADNATREALQQAITDAQKTIDENGLNEAQPSPEATPSSDATPSDQTPADDQGNS